MPNYVTINGTAYPDFTAAFGAGVAMVNGVYYPTGEPPQYGSPPSIEDPVYDRRKVKFPGVAGQGRKDFALLGRKINIQLILVGSLAVIGGYEATLFTSIKQLARYTIVMPSGTSFLGCVAMEPCCGVPSQWSMSDKVCRLLPLTFEQLSETN